MDNVDLDKPLQAYLSHIKSSYAEWSNVKDDKLGISASIKHEMHREFCSSVSAVAGRKYIKVVAGGSAHSFIVVQRGGGFEAGDILKAATWAAPARNFSRGNIIRQEWSNVTWTGAN